jgi:hypothetical protein
MAAGERPVETHLDQADRFALPVQALHCRLHRRGCRAHRDDDPLRTRMPDVLERLVAATGSTGEAEHCLLEQARHRGVEGAGRLTALEEDIRVLGRAAQTGTIR